MRRSDRVQRTHDAILEAAAAAFAEQGFGGASIDDVAARAGVSKPTIYSHFGSKDGLCEALMVTWIERVEEDAGLRFVADDDPHEALSAFAIAHTRLVLDPDQIGLVRAFVAELISRPEWARQVFAQMPDKGLAPYLRDAHIAGVLDVPDTDTATTMFWAAVKGVGFYPYIMGMAGERTADEHAADVREAVGMFLARYRV